MKKIIFLILLSYSYLLFSQHPELTSQRWFVQNVTVNGTTTNIPNDPVNFPLVDIYLFNGGTNLVGSGNLNVNNDCQVGFFGHLNYTATNVFNFNDFTPFSTITACDTSILDFMNFYVNFYNDEITEDFTYTITNLTGIKTLIVTNNAGNQIEYTSKVFEDVPSTIVDIDWLLTDLMIDGINYTTPNNNEVDSVSISFLNDDNDELQNFSTGVCASLFGMHNFIENENTFHLYEIIATLNNCSVENLTFENLYLDFFMNNGSNAFSYEIINSGEYLIITDILGNTARYHNGVASTEDYTNSLFNTYPNPVKDNLIIEEKTSLTIENITIYNYLGKRLFTTKNKIINMSHLETGLYLVKIKLQNGKIAIKKIIKS